MAEAAKSPSLLMVISKFIRIFAAVNTVCPQGQFAATQKWDISVSMLCI